MRRGYPLFVDLKNVLKLEGGDSKIIYFLNGGACYGSRQPRDILYMVIDRIMKHQSMHVVDFENLWNALCFRYRSRISCPIQPALHIGMVKRTRYGFESDGFLYDHDRDSAEWVKIEKAIEKRNLALRKASKRFLKQMESNRQLRELFYLNSEMEGMTNGTKAWIWREKSNSTRKPAGIDWLTQHDHG